MITDEEYAEATKRGEERLRIEPRAISATYNAQANTITIELN